MFLDHPWYGDSLLRLNPRTDKRDKPYKKIQRGIIFFRRHLEDTSGWHHNTNLKDSIQFDYHVQDSQEIQSIDADLLAQLRNHGIAITSLARRRITHIFLYPGCQLAEAFINLDT